MTPSKKPVRTLDFPIPAGAPVPAPKAGKVPPKPKDEYPDRVAYVGMTTSQDGSKEWAVFVQLKETEWEGLYLPNPMPAERLLHYSPKTARSLMACRPGAIFRARVNAEKAIEYQRRAAPVGYVHDDLRFEWQAADSAIRKSIAGRKAAEREGKRNLVQEQCEPLRRAYVKCPTGMAKAQLLAEIVFHISRIR